MNSFNALRVGQRPAGFFARYLASRKISKSVGGPPERRHRYFTTISRVLVVSFPKMSITLTTI